VAAVLCSGENLYTNVRRQIKSALAAEVYEAYTSREGGIMALSCRNQTGLHVIADRARLEVLESGGVAKENRRGTLIVTNLENWAMPTIRYITDDSAVLETGKCACGFEGSTVVTMYGRDSVYFLTRSGPINSSLLDPIFESHCLEYHVCQQEKERFDVAYRSRADLSAHIRQGLTRLLGDVAIYIKRQSDDDGTSKRPRYEVASRLAAGRDI